MSKEQRKASVPVPDRGNKTGGSRRKANSPLESGAAACTTSSYPDAVKKANDRMRWTPEMEEILVKVYLEDKGTNVQPPRGYRKRVYSKFLERCPNSNSAWQEQHVINKLNLIIEKKKYVPTSKIAEIRDKVETERNWSEINQIMPGTSADNNYSKTVRKAPEVKKRPENLHKNSAVSSLETEQEDVETNNQSETELLLELNRENEKYYNNIFIGPLAYHEDKIRLEFEKALEKFQNSKVEERPRLCKVNTSKKLSLAVNAMNTKILPRYLLDSGKDINRIINLLYCAAVAVTSYAGKNVFVRTVKGEKKKPKFMVRIESQINKKMSEVGRINEILKGNKSEKLKGKVEQILKNYKVHANHGDINENLEEVADTIKQTLAKLGARLRRYNKSAKRKSENALFKNNEKMFYRQLKTGKSTDSKSNSKLPSQSKLEEFWRGVWSNPKRHNSKAKWIEEEVDSNRNVEDMESPKITATEITSAISKAHNWKAPGVDKVQNFWIKHLGCTHSYIAEIFNEFQKDPKKIPKELTLGVTYLLPKDSSKSEDPSKYRPITCLSTMYKLLTSIIANRIYKHLEDNNILAEEQKGCRRGAKGSKEQAIIDEAVTGQARYRNRNLFTAYIDYQKAFDSVPHSWIVEVLKIYKINPQIIRLIETVMRDWRTTLVLGGGDQEMKTNMIQILNGIFQGDSLSPLLFCLALNPLSRMLKDSKVGYLVNRTDKSKMISHLFFMDYIKLYGTTLQTLKTLLRIVEDFSEDICMKFGIDKCKIQSMIAGKIESDFQCKDGEIIESMKEQETYKYLGFVQSKRNEHKKIKRALKSEFLSRVGKISGSKLSGKNLVKAINTYAVSTLTYSFGVMKWNKDELESLRVGINKIMTRNRQHHPRASKERMTLPRNEGGRGLIDLHVLHRNQIANLRDYFQKKAQTSVLHAAIVEIGKKYTPLNLSSQSDEYKSISKNEVVRNKLEMLKSKSLHGRHQKALACRTVDRNASNSWLGKSGLFAETEGFLIAIQDEMLPTKNFKKYITKDKKYNDDRCRLCHKCKETVTHIISGCQKIAGTDYTERHNQVAKIILQKLA
jgi:hypothetical protein